MGNEEIIEELVISKKRKKIGLGLYRVSGITVKPKAFFCFY